MSLYSKKTIFHGNICFLFLVLVLILLSFPRFSTNAEPGDSFANAIEIKLGYVMGNFTGPGEKIYYRLTVTYPEWDPFGPYDWYMTYFFLTPQTGSTDFDPDIYLYYPPSEYLASSAASGYLVDGIEWKEEGFKDIYNPRDNVVTYIIEIRCYAGSGGFSLKIYFDWDWDWGSSPENAYLLGYTDLQDTTFELGDTTGSLPGPGAMGEMWYVIPLMAEDYNFTLTGPEDTDFNLDLYDSTLTHIDSASGDSYPDKLSTWNLDPGEYGIKISSVQGSGTYILSIVKADITPPDVTIINPSNGIFTQANVTLSYIVSEGSTTIYLDNIANTTALESGSVLPDLAEGSHNITIVAVDIARNVGTATILFTVDITSPSVIILNPANKEYSENKIQLSYSVSDGISTIYLDNIANDTALPSDSVLPDLAEGSHNITIIAVDAAGNKGTATVLFTVDTISPLIAINSPTSNFYSVNFISIALSGEADNYWYYIEGVDTENHTWPFVLERGLDDGSYILYAYGNDSVGNIGHGSVNITIDASSPIIDHPNDIVYSIDNGNNLPAIITWHPSDINPASYTISCNDTIIKSSVWNGTSISVNISELTPNTYVFVCTAYDKAGNSVSDSVLVTVTPHSQSSTSSQSSTQTSTSTQSPTPWISELGILVILSLTAILKRMKITR